MTWCRKSKASGMKSTHEVAYLEADRLYARGDIDGWTDADTRDVARRITREGHRTGAPITLPPAGRASIFIGTLLELHLWERGRIRVYKYPTRGAPPLLWSCQRSALYALPGRSLPTPTVSAYTFPDALKAYRGWNQGKYPRGASAYKIPPIRMQASVPAIAIGYWSDKFSDQGVYEHYIHHFETGVMGSKGPGAFFVRGGRLTLTPEGLDH